jgi:uncharacterized integral membrane protein
MTDPTGQPDAPTPGSRARQHDAGDLGVARSRGPLSQRSLGLIILVASLVGLTVAAVTMAQRLSARDVENVYFHKPVGFERFEYADGWVSVSHVPSDESPEGALRVAYKGEHVDFPIRGGRFDERLEAGRQYDDWFKVLPMVTGVRSAQEATQLVESGEITPRLIVAARYPAPELKDGSWNLVQRRNWVYQFAEIHPDGSGASPGGNFTVASETYRALDALHTPGPHTPIDLIPSPEERAQNLWMHFAMQQVTPPRFFRAKDRNLDSALEAMTWTWPLAGVSALGVIVGGLVTASAGLKRRA